MTKKSFIAYTDWLDNCEDLSDEEFGQLMRAVMKYAKDGEKPAFADRVMRACWNPIRQAIDRAGESYEQRCERNRQNGKKGGRPKKNEEAEKPKKQTVFSKTLNDNDNDNGNDNKNESDAADAAKSALTREAASAAPAEFSSWEKEQIVTEWNTNKTTKNIFRIDPMSARSENALACVELVGFEKFLEVIGSADNQGFFQKRFQNGKPITFDWFVKPENFTKVIEGNYAEEWSDDGLVVHEGWEVV